MKPINARLIISMLGTYTLNEIISAGALEAVTELNALASPKGGIYILVPTDERGPRKVEAIKTLRVLFEMGLKEAKDAIDEAFVVNGMQLPDGSYRIGPFNYMFGNVAAAMDNYSRATNRNGLLELEVI